MNPKEALEWLSTTQLFGIKLGLENIERLVAALGNPEKDLAIFHIAGTNGKGSVCALLDSLARASGRKTGLYTSPHLIAFPERVRVNGVKISERAQTKILTDIREATKDWDHAATFFEITTALALRHFADEGCELVILETGMGGRLDATNAVTPLVSVLTPIALDHTQWLGTTLAEVAGEKAGIIKPGVPVVSVPQESEVEAVLRSVAAKSNAPFQIIKNSVKEHAIGLSGSFQQQNAALALAAFSSARLPLDPAAVVAGLRDVRWPGRFQVIEDGRIVLDGSHNPHAAQHLVQNWREHYGDEKALIIFAALSDKDYPQILQTLAPIAERILTVPVQNHRAASPSDLATVLPNLCRPMNSLSEAIAEARPSSLRILITGSLFLVGEAMELLGLEV